MKIRYLLLILIYSVSSCQLNNVSNNKNSAISIGEGNYIYYMPDKSKNIKIKDIKKSIEVHENTIKEIEKTINSYESKEKELDSELDSRNISKKDYKNQIKETKSKIAKLNNEKNNANKALEIWKELLKSEDHLKN